MTITTRVIRDSLLNVGRLYYRSEVNKMYCIDPDGTWYFCSEDGEPQEEIDVEVIDRTSHSPNAILTLKITFKESTHESD